MLLVFMIFMKEVTVLDRKRLYPFFKLLFLGDSGGEEQGDGLLG